MRNVIADHAKRYPFWEIDDVYKLVHQAAMGSEHAVGDRSGARAWLAREMEEMGSGPEEPLIDPISPDGSIVRVHLRPYVRRGLDPELLLEAFVATGRELRGLPNDVGRGLSEAAQLAREGVLPFSDVDLERLRTRMQSVGFPAVHHTATYVSRYRPAYRVVARATLPLDAAGSRR